MTDSWPAGPGGERAAGSPPRDGARAGGPARLRGLLVDVVGLEEDPARRHPTVEANARLTAATGLLLVVLLFLEGLTVPFVAPLLSWHVAIGLALVPPVLLKLASTSWRFARYYLGDARYRLAGPPHPLLRALGPLVVVSTVALLASGIASWLAGPRHPGLVEVHKLSFVVWFLALGVHVLAHVLRAARLAARDAREARGSRPSSGRARARRALVAASLAGGLCAGAVGHLVTTGWSHVRAVPDGLGRPAR